MSNLLTGSHGARKSDLNQVKGEQVQLVREDTTKYNSYCMCVVLFSLLFQFLSLLHLHYVGLVLVLVLSQYLIVAHQHLTNSSINLVQELKDAIISRNTVTCFKSSHNNKTLEYSTTS